jgi:hypothetical protein
LNTILSKKIVSVPLLVLLAFALAWLVSVGNIPAILGLVSFPFIVYVIYLLFHKPESGLILVLVLGFSINGFARYISLQYSIFIDGVIIMACIAAFFHSGYSDYQRLASVTVGALLFWTFYTIMEIFNPESIGILPWFYAVRSVSFYVLVVAALTILVFKTKKHLQIFLIIWFVFGILSALYGMKQVFIGLNSVEKAWLANGAAKTHLLFGKLRVFSFYSDAGQFGAFMSFTSLVAFIMAVRAESFKLKCFYLITGVLSGYGMLISGTRGALFVYIGAMVYLLLDKNFKTFIIGLFILGSIFFLLRFTYLGASNYNIQRMRSAVKPKDDASFQVRVENQRKFSEYLKDKPFGGGIGTSGYWGQRFHPKSFLAQTPTDSWYVRIWAETGQVGLILYLLTLAGILIHGFVLILNLKDVYLKQKLSAIYAGCFGVLIANYGNQVIGQFPTIVVFSMGIGIVCLGKLYDNESQVEPNRESISL